MLKTIDEETLKKLQNSKETKILQQEMENFQKGKLSALTEIFVDEGEVDWDLVESFKRALEDLKAGRLEEV